MRLARAMQDWSQADRSASIFPPLVVPIIVDGFIVDVVKEGDHVFGLICPCNQGVQEERIPGVMPGHSHQEVLNAVPPNVAQAKLRNRQDDLSLSPP
jgi:hypothetical protein